MKNSKIFSFFCFSLMVRFIFDEMETDEMLRVLCVYYLWKKWRSLNRRKRRSYVRGINAKRPLDGAFARLIRPMRSNFNDDHFQYFRMTPARFDDLLRRVGPIITHEPTHAMPISAMERLAITLRLLASGDSSSSIAYQFRVSESAVSKIVQEMTKAIWTVLKEEFLAVPTRGQWREITIQFWENWNFPLCVGAIDGKHVAIKNPPRAASLHFNYKNFYSVVLLAVVDAQYNFIFVDVGGLGSDSDAGLFNKSEFGRRIEHATDSYDQGGLGIPYDKPLPGSTCKSPHVFLGDQGFALMRHLMIPYTFGGCGPNEHLYNYRHSRARRVSEQAFGILSTRWRIFENRIDVKVATVDNIVLACICLHNFLKSVDHQDYKEPRYVPPNYLDYENDQGEVVMGEWRNNVRGKNGLFPLERRKGPKSTEYTIRENFKRYFSTPEGEVPWQQAVLEKTVSTYLS